MKYLLIPLLSFFPLLGQTLFWLEPAFRQDSLQWSLVTHDGSQKTVSDLKWHNIQMIDIAGGFSTSFCDSWIFSFAGDYGKVFDGYVVDKDHGESVLSSEIRASANKGEAFDLSLGVGRLFIWEKWSVTPMVGVAHAEQHFRLIHGKAYWDASEEGIAFPDLHSNYRTRWSSLWVGASKTYEATESFTLYSQIQIHAARYKAYGHWNLRKEFVDDFCHTGWGLGGYATAGFSYRIYQQWHLGLKGDIRYFEIRNGVDRTDYLDEQTGALQKGRGRLKKVTWQSFSVGISLIYGF